ncbi:helix-turn-helix domain-containing protein [Paenibacillus apiarius]|uniref:helix-turn-helix domain-containing protein n=1 Tax=Paenibacillus apiarius TaxID=46240 RepID=UPI003B3AD80E
MSAFQPTMEIRIKLGELLEERGLGQRELSRMIGVRHPSIHEMCQNKTVRLPLDNLAAICEALGVGIMDVLELVPIEEHEKEPQE